MGDYIKRETAIDFVKNSTPNIEGETTIQCVERALQVVPAADVVEVRHGEWEHLEFNAFNRVGTCSVCKKRMKLFERRYCPLCGAKMDGKGEGEC